MLALFRKTASDSAAIEPPRTFSVGERRRVYAVGDIHGRLDLLDRLVEQIVTDNFARGLVDDLHLVLLGDLVDRGPDSAQVIDRVLQLRETLPGFACLRGNHEEVFSLALLGDPGAINLFRNIGAETLLSYGIDEMLIDDGSESELQDAMLSHVPEAHRDFLFDLPDHLVIGDYLFVHAGIRPGVPIEGQRSEDLRWIRREFLTSEVAHSHMVVHGHSITDDVDERFNRIGIDTGAYASERLTAIGLEGEERWFLST
jgi:serine/threonine protein phosphatase 1